MISAVNNENKSAAVMDDLSTLSFICLSIAGVSMNGRIKKLPDVVMVSDTNLKTELCSIVLFILDIYPRNIKYCSV